LEVKSENERLRLQTQKAQQQLEDERTQNQALIDDIRSKSSITESANSELRQRIESYQQSEKTIKEQVSELQSKLEVLELDRSKLREQSQQLQESLATQQSLLEAKVSCDVRCFARNPNDCFLKALNLEQATTESSRLRKLLEEEGEKQTSRMESQSLKTLLQKKESELISKDEQITDLEKRVQSVKYEAEEKQLEITEELNGRLRDREVSLTASLDKIKQLEEELGHTHSQLNEKVIQIVI